MGQKDLSEKILVAYDDVFADIVNVLLFKGQSMILPEELEERGAKAVYKEDGLLHELDRDMVFRVIGYDGTTYRAQLNEKMSEVVRYPVLTIVLYFEYQKRWNSPVSLLEKVEVPEGLDSYVPDYRMNLFEIAYLSEEQVKLFQSDFKIVADYFVQKRKNKEYRPSNMTIRHVEAVLQLLSVMENDSRFLEIQYMENGRKVETMCDVLDRAIEKGVEQGVNEERKALMSTMYKNGYTVKQIAQMTDREELEVKDILQLL